MREPQLGHDDETGHPGDRAGPSEGRGSVARGGENEGTGRVPGQPGEHRPGLELFESGGREGSAALGPPPVEGDPQLAQAGRPGQSVTAIGNARAGPLHPARDRQPLAKAKEIGGRTVWLEALVLVVGDEKGGLVQGGTVENETVVLDGTIAGATS